MDNYVYTLESIDKTYIKNIEFIGFMFNVGDYLFLPDEVLDEDNIYTYGKIIDGKNEKNLIKVISNGVNYYLERYYG